MQPEPSIQGGPAGDQADRFLATLAELLKPDVDPARYLESVTACLGHSAEPVRQLAVVVLGRIGAPAADALIRALAAQQPTAIRMTAALELASVGAPAAGGVRELCRCLTSSDEGLRTAAGVALAKIGAPAVPALCLMLRFSGPDTLAAAVSALAFIGPPAAAAAPELDALAARAALPLQLACAAALVRITGDPARGLPVLLHARSSPDPAVRQLAIERIGELQQAGQAAAPYLLHSLGDPEPPVRAAAALAMARVQVPAAQSLQPLSQLLDDPVPEVRVHACIALSGLGRDAAQALPGLRARAGDLDPNVASAAGAAAEMIEKAA
ncbi:MAG: HEAT repeat domain-containing protein [Bryobacteraceae bacterium]|nr:HEAT repeat domain-containing protein [Bryobacteraceae bacterium]